MGERRRLNNEPCEQVESFEALRSLDVVYVACDRHGAARPMHRVMLIRYAHSEALLPSGGRAPMRAWIADRSPSCAGQLNYGVTDVAVMKGDVWRVLDAGPRRAEPLPPRRA
jgi:hypothetical protein